VTARWEGLAPSRQRAIRDGLIVAGLLINAAFLLALPPNFAWFVDAPSWWLINLDDLYGVAEQSLTASGAFRMAPVVAWAMYPLTLLPTWEAFIGTYLVLNLAAVVALTGRRAVLLIAAFPPILLELVNGNIHLFMALAIWAGMRWPGAWAFVLLTKVTPGVGILWFAIRREWRRFAVAVGTTLAVVGVGFLLAPAQWTGWFEFLTTATTLPQVGTLPALAIRLPLAALLVAFAARTDRAWLIPFACLLAMPTIWLQSSALLLACFPLYWERERFQTGARMTEEAPARTATFVRATEPEGRA
jgi:hypothetical protein